MIVIICHCLAWSRLRELRIRHLERNCSGRAKVDPLTWRGAGGSSLSQAATFLLTPSKQVCSNKLLLPRQTLAETFDTQGCLASPKWMNFRKSSKRPLIPLLIFGKLYCRFRDKIVTKVRMFIMMYYMILFHMRCM